MEIRELTIETLRTAFPHEAQHLTRWLELNPDALGKRLGLSLSEPQREYRVGDFTVDLLCVDDQGHRVIVENQLEKTDHSHLGQLLVYLVNLEAKTAVWITSMPRAEHQSVINWLNEITPADTSFYLVKVEAIRISEGVMAPLFSVICGPDPQAKSIGETKEELAHRHQLRIRFWRGLLELCRTRGNRFANRQPSKSNWIGVGAGISSCEFTFVVLFDGARIELYIDYDKESGELNKRLFDLLATRREELERGFGEKLNWERLDGKRACRISYSIETDGLTNEFGWKALQEKMVYLMENFEKVMRPALADARGKLHLEASTEM